MGSRGSDGDVLEDGVRAARGVARRRPPGQGPGLVGVRPTAQDGPEGGRGRRTHFMAPAARPPMMRFWARKKRISIGRETNTAPAMITPQLL